MKRHGKSKCAREAAYRKKGSHTQLRTHQDNSPPRMPPKSKQTTETTALAQYDSNRRTWIYIVTDPANGHVVYAGQSVDTSRRWKQHETTSSGARRLRAYMAERSYPLKFEIVPELLAGFPHSRADEFEGFFINKHDTIFHFERRPDGCNQTHAKNSVTHDYAAIGVEIAKIVEAGGYEWPDKTESVELIAAQAEEEMLAALDIEVGGEVEYVSTALVAATQARKQVERADLGVIGVAKREFAVYEAMPPHLMVPRDTVAASLNEVIATAPDDEELKKQAKWWMAGIHSDRFPDRPVTSTAAKYTLGIAVEWLGNQAEAAIDVDNTTIRNLIAVREWSAANGGKKPAPHAKDATERKHGGYLSQWKSREKMPHQAEARFLFRHYPLLLKYMDYDLKAVGAKIETALSNALFDGYKHRDEPGDYMPIPTKGIGDHGDWKPIHQKVRHLVQGQCDEDTVLRIVKALPEARRKWYVDKAKANRPRFLESHAKIMLHFKAKLHASGVKPRTTKKRKVEEESAPVEEESAPVEEEVDEDSDEGEEESGDEEDEESNED